MSLAYALSSPGRRGLSRIEERRLQIVTAGGVVALGAMMLLTQLLSLAHHGLACLG